MLNYSTCNILPFFEVASINAKGHLYNLLVAVKLRRKVGRNAQWVYEMQG